VVRYPGRNLPTTKAPPITIPSIAVDPAALIQSLERLRLGLKAFADEQNESNVTQQEKNGAFGVDANLMSTYLEMAGEPELPARSTPPTCITSPEARRIEGIAHRRDGLARATSSGGLLAGLSGASPRGATLGRTIRSWFL